jgi:isoleucyl-tRNA synthetase
VRRVVELGRQARGEAGLKLRQPLRRLVVQGAAAAQGHADEIAEELRVKEVHFGAVDAVEVRVKPNLPVLGPKLGKELGAVRAALEAGRFEQLDGGGVRVNGRELGADEVLVERGAREGWALAEDDSLTVAVTTELDDELRLEARVLDLIHQLNTMRKDAGLALTDRIRVTLPEADADLLEHEAWIKEEVLATEIRTDGVAEPQIAKI